MNAITVMMIVVTASTGAATSISEQCRVRDTTNVVCVCVGNEEFSLPEGYNYERVTSLRVASCRSANLHFSSLTEANRITEIVVQNISELLTFELFLTSKTIERLELSKIQRIPLITPDTFVKLKAIAALSIQDTRIDHFQERFTDVRVSNLTIANVIIDRIDGLNFSEKGETLRITDSEFRNVTSSLNFAHFSTVKILRSRFHLQKPGHVSIEGDTVSLEDCVFSNVSANIVAASSISINASCADGKSSMRLSSVKIDSVNNRLPTEIVYTKSKPDSERFLVRNNTVCIAGNCKCPKSGTGQILPILLHVLLPLTLLHLA